MKRSLKNIIMIAIIISLGICSYFTMKGTNSNQTTNKGEIQQAQNGTQNPNSQTKIKTK